MPQSAPILMTGGSGLLGGAMRALRPSLLCPDSARFNIVDYPGMLAYADSLDAPVATLFHAAAFARPALADSEPERTLETNILGTANVVRLCMLKKWRLVYVSTDYVFRGDSGGYGEDDALYPVNAYGWSKLGGECAARIYPRSLIVRTSFGPEPFPYEKAFVDQWTSREGVGRIAEKMIRLAESDLTGVIHVGGARRTVMEYARSIAGGREIGPLSVAEVPFKAPVDTSLDCSRYARLFPDEKGR